MKKRFMIPVLIALCCLCGCGGGADGSAASVDGTEGETEVDAMNRTMIAEALGIAEDSRSIRFILSSLDTIGAGQIQSAESVEADGGKAIDLVAEDGTNYRIYLTRSGGVDSVKDLDTGEWPIRSER